MAVSTRSVKIIASLDSAGVKQGTDKVNAELKGTEAPATSAGDTMKDAFMKVSVAVIAAVAAIKQIGQAISSSVEAFKVQETAEKKLEFALGDLTEKYKELASEWQNLKGVGDETTISLFAFAKNVGIADDQLENAVETAINVNKALGVDMQTALTGIKNEIEGNSSVLRRYVPELRNLAEEGISGGEALEFLSEKFDGAAESMRDTTTGELENFQNTIGDTKEVLGEMLTKGLTPLIKGFNKISGALNDAFSGKVDLQTATVSLIEIYNRYAEAQDQLTTQTNELTNAERANLEVLAAQMRLNIADKVKDIVKAVEEYENTTITMSETGQIRQNVLAFEREKEVLEEQKEAWESFYGDLDDMANDLSQPIRMNDLLGEYEEGRNIWTNITGEKIVEQLATVNAELQIAEDELAVTTADYESSMIDFMESIDVIVSNTDATMDTFRNMFVAQGRADVFDYMVSQVELYRGEIDNVTDSVNTLSTEISTADLNITESAGKEMSEVLTQVEILKQRLQEVQALYEANGDSTGQLSGMMRTIQDQARTLTDEYAGRLDLTAEEKEELEMLNGINKEFVETTAENTEELEEQAGYYELALSHLTELSNSAFELGDALGYSGKEAEALQNTLNTALNVGENLMEGDWIGAIVSGVSGLVSGIVDWISGTEEEEEAMEEVNEQLEQAESTQLDIYRWVRETAEILSRDSDRLSKKYDLMKKIAEMTGEGIDQAEQASLDETAIETLEAYEIKLQELLERKEDIEYQLANPNPQHYAPGVTMIGGSDEEIMEAIKELEIEILQTEMERLDFQQDITAEMEKQNRLTEKQSRLVDELQGQIDVGLLDVESVLDIGGIQSQLVGAGITGLMGAETLQGLGVTGSNYSNAVNIGTIQQTIYEAGPEYAAQSAAGAITNAIGG